MTNCETENLDNTEVTETNTAQQKIPADHIQKIKNVGYDTSDLTFNTGLSAYIVEGDILLPRDFIDQMDLNQTAAKHNIDSRFGLVDCWKVKDIKIRHSPDFPEYLRTALEVAVNEWNSTSGTNIRFRYVDDQQDIYIFGSNDLAKDTTGAAVPSGLFLEDLELNGQRTNKGRPGNFIAFNLKESIEWTNWVTIIRHELGHTLGLDHTNIEQGPGYYFHRRNEKRRSTFHNVGYYRRFAMEYQSRTTFFLLG